MSSIVGKLFKTVLCGMQDPSSLIRNRTRPPCTGNTKPQPLDHQKSQQTVLSAFAREINFLSRTTLEMSMEGKGLPGGSVVKDPPANLGDSGSIPGSGRSPGEWNGNPLQYPCLGNLMDRGAWPATICGAAKSQTQLTKQQQMEGKQSAVTKSGGEEGCLLTWKTLVVCDRAGKRFL